jgi:hypothetical protein
MAITTYRDRIGIGLSYDRKFFGREGAEEFLQLYTRLMLEASNTLTRSASEAEAGSPTRQ